MLLAIMVIAAVAFAVQEWLRLRDAREQFDYAWYNWQTYRATVENVVLASARLMKAEAASPWISRQTAQQQHVDRLNKLLESVASPPTGSRPEETERQAAIVRRAIDRHQSSSDPAHSR